MMRRSLLIVVALVLVAGAAACGGGKGEDNASTKRDKDSGDETSGSDSSDSTEPGEIGDAATAERPPSSQGEETPSSDEPVSADLPSGEPGDIGTAFDTDYSFTGEGGETFCSQMADLQAQYATADPETVNLSDLANKMEAIAPPPELADDWPGYIEMERALGSSDGEGDLAEADPEQLAAFTSASAKVSVYLTDVCGL